MAASLGTFSEAEFVAERMTEGAQRVLFETCAGWKAAKAFAGVSFGLRTRPAAQALMRDGVRTMTVVAKRLIGGSRGCLVNVLQN